MTSFWLFLKNKDRISFLLFVVACSNWLPSSKSITANRRLVSILVYEKCCFFGVHLLYNTSSTPIWQNSPNNLDLLKHSYTERSFAMPQKLLILAIPILFSSLACWSSEDEYIEITYFHLPTFVCSVCKKDSIFHAKYQNMYPFTCTIRPPKMISDQFYPFVYYSYMRMFCYQQVIVFQCFWKNATHQNDG